MLEVYFMIVAVANLAAGGGIPERLCGRVRIDVDPAYVGFVQLGGAYSLQPFTWSDFPVFKHEQLDLYLHYNRTTRLMLIGPRKGELLGMGATTTAFSDNWLPSYAHTRPFGRVIDRWFYYDYVRQARFFVDYLATTQLGPVCIPDNVMFRPCHSGIFAFNDVILQEQSDGRFNFINKPSDYYERQPGIYKNARPVYKLEGSTRTAYLSYSNSFEGWLIGDDYNYDSGYMYLTTNAMHLEFISGGSNWQVYTNDQFQANSQISLDCRGIQTNQSCAESNPCRNGGSCLQRAAGDVICVCTSNSTGLYCEKPQIDICPRPSTAATEAQIWSGIHEGSLSTTFCGEGYTPDYYFSVCEQLPNTPGAGEWIRYGSCEVKTTPVPRPPVTRPPVPTIRNPFSWSSWSNEDDWSRSQEDSYEEPEWLWKVILTLIILITVCGPFIIYVVLKYHEQDEEFDEAKNDSAHSGVGATENANEKKRQKLAEAYALLDKERGKYTDEEIEEQRQKIAVVIGLEGGAQTQASEPEQERKEKRKRKKSRIRNVSMCRILSITSFFNVWFWIPWFAGCVATTCGLYSSTLLTMAIFGFCIIVLAYITMLCESIFSREKAYISKLGEASTVAMIVSNIRKTQPVITWHAKCYHYETRTRIVTYTDGNGNLQSRTETYQEMVITHTDFETFHFGYWTDDSAPEIRGVEKYRVTRIRMAKNILPGDMETSSAYVSGFEEFQERNKNKDVFMDTWIEESVAGFEERIAAFVGQHTRPWWMKMLYYWLTVLLGVTWPYRWYFRAKTGKTHYIIKKRYYLSRPEDEDVHQYDMASAAVVEQELRKSMVIDQTVVAPESPDISEEDDTIDISVDTGKAHVQISM